MKGTAAMRIDLALRLGSYLTLALSCACLGYAEVPFLPAFPYFLVGVGFLFVIAFFVEGRWSLPAWAANLFGALIALGAVGWVVHQHYLRTRGGIFTAEDIPWPAALLPHVGPVLTLLVAVKLFRPKKVGDYWALQTIGLLQVTLACVMSGTMVFGMLVLAYFGAGLWCLSLLQLHRAQLSLRSRPVPLPPGRKGKQPEGGRGWAAGVPPSGGSRHPPPEGGTQPRLPSAFGLVPSTLRRALLGTAVGLLLFLGIPRHGDSVWNSDRLASAPLRVLRTGFSGDLDLNRTGLLQVSDQPAFTVTARDRQGRPKLDLSPQQRWRGITMDVYYRGHWNVAMTEGLLEELGLVPASDPQERPDKVHKHLHTNPDLPDLGPDQWTLTLEVNRRQAGGFVLAEPVILGPGEGVHPYHVKAVDGAATQRHLFFEFDGTLIQLRRARRGTYHYEQVLAPRPQGQEDLSVPRWLEDSAFRRMNFNSQPLPEIRAWTETLLARLVEEGRYGLTSRHLVPAKNGVGLREENWEPVARALCEYLASSGEFTYSLLLRRHDERIDPTLDFLTNVKQGHCERFASALALILRSQGIPARVVQGFRGAEHQGDGKYVVRQSDAHSWVEALVPARALGGRRAWLTLDPTPSSEAAAADGFDWARFWEQLQLDAEYFWKVFVVDANPERQREALSRLWASLDPAGRLSAVGDWVGDSFRGRFWAKAGFWVLTLSAALVLWKLGRRFRPGPGRAPAQGAAIGVGFYARLLAIFARRCDLRPRPGQTAREFGAAARERLEQIPAAIGLAGLPGQVADLFYQVRFGGRELPDAQGRDIQRQLDRLDQALTAGGGERP
jgi:transglutaminase-like putative cysteine protease